MRTKFIKGRFDVATKSFVQDKYLVEFEGKEYSFDKQKAMYKFIRETKTKLKEYGTQKN